MLGRIFPPALTTTIPMLEDRYFTFTSFQKAANIFLMSQYDHQCYRDSKDTIDRIIDIKNDKYKNWESDACQYGTKGNKSC